MKRILSAACLVLTPVTALAEQGTELAHWSQSQSSDSQQQGEAPATPPAQPSDAPQQAPASGGPAATATEAKPAEEEKVKAGSAVLTPEQLAKLQGLFVSASIDQYVGLGTFVAPDRASSVGTWVNAFLSYRKIIGGRNFALGVQPFGAQGVTYEYTMPDNATGRRIVNDDARIALSMPALYKSSLTGITLNPNINIIIPTTPMSWHAGLITRLGVGGSAQRGFGLPIGSLQASLGGFATYGIYTQTANVVKPDDRRDQQGNNVVLTRAGETYADIAGNNSMINVRASVGATWLVNDWFFISGGYGVIANWKYPSTNQRDQFTPQGMTSTGQNSAREGMVEDILQFASVSVAVNITDVISASLYLYNLAPMFTRNYQGIRFPLVDYTGLPNNFTIVGLSLAATF
ncbi:MAG: hypothetical protein JNK82_01815 [Myxococcaceae bacterium]|nr:hypothetical protein [Myxococcaceae bacterium]